MTMHTVAWQEAHDNTANTPLAAIADTIIQTQGDFQRFDMDRKIVWAAQVCDDAQRARLSYPAARQFSLPFIAPVVDDAVRSNPLAIADYRENPLILPAREDIGVDGTHDDAGSPVDTVVMGCERSAPQPMPGGQIYTMRATSSTSAAVGGWRDLVMSFPDTLPTYLFGLVGLRYVGAEARALRVVFEEQVDRPGCLAVEDENQAGWPAFRMGGLGVWGTFRGDRMPNFQALTAATLAAHIVYLDYMRIG